MELQKALEVALAMIAAVSEKKIIVGNALGYNPTCAPYQGGLLAAIVDKGGEIVSEEMCISQLQGDMYRVVYQTEQRENRVAYINAGRVDIDAFVEESLIFNLQDDPKEEVVALFEAARKQLEDNHKKTMETLRFLDKDVPPSFRRLILNKDARAVAANLYRANGELSQAVFDPWKGTLAYPRDDIEAKKFFDEQPCWVEHKDTPEAYMLVGQMVAEGLLP